MKVWRQNGPGQKCTVELDDTDAQEQEQKIAVVVSSNTVIYPCAVVITSCYTYPTQRAVLASCGLDKVAGTAEVVGSEEYVIVGILSHCGCVIDGVEIVSLACDAEVGKGVGS